MRNSSSLRILLTIAHLPLNLTGACNADSFYSVSALSALPPADCLFPDMEVCGDRVGDIHRISYHTKNHTMM